MLYEIKIVHFLSCQSLTGQQYFLFNLEQVPVNLFMPERTDGLVRTAFSRTVPTSSDHTRSQGTRSHGNNCGDRGWHEDVRYGGMSCRMVRAQTAKRCQQRTIQKQKSDTRKQISKTDTDWNRMGSIKNPKLFLLLFQLHPDHSQEKSKMKIQVAIARKILVAIWHMLSKEQDFIDIYLKRLEENRKMEEQLKSLESKMAWRPFDIPSDAM